MAEEFSFLHACEICGQDGFLEDELQHHFKTVHIDGAVSCPFCELSCANLTPAELSIHVNSAHLEYLTPKKRPKQDQQQSSEIVSQPSTSSTRGPVSLATKSECQLSFQDEAKSSLSKPEERTTATPNNVVCPLCEFSASTPSKVQGHVNSVHQDRNILNYDCPLCHKPFASVIKLELHIESFHENAFNSSKGLDENLSCPVCNITTITNQDELAIHVDEHFSALPGAMPANLKSTKDESSFSLQNEQFQTDFLLAQKLAAEERERRNLEEQKEFQQLRAQFGMDNKGNYKQQNQEGMQRAVCSGRLSVQEFYERQANAREASHIGLDEGHSVTRSITPKLRSFSENSYGVSRAFITTSVDHHASSFGDKGWGCGYRNLQMLLSSLAHYPAYAECLSSIMDTKNMHVPSIERLQDLIEVAWSMGIDRQGCDQLEGKLKNTNKWIGATEIVAFLTSRGIRTELLDFHIPTASDGSHPRLFQWVLDYFRSNQDQFCPPLFFQHQGHSRTIVGVEVTSRNSDSSTRLLVFDPSHSKAQMSKLAGAATKEDAAPILKILRNTISNVKSNQYQIVAVKGIFQSQQEMERHKILQSKRIP